MRGAVAELGVYQGDTAAYINKIFANDEFYLFDTFGGFDEKDCEVEIVKGLSKAHTYDFADTSLDFVKSKMPYPKNCHFVKGYFPQSTRHLKSDLKFKFVNIDCDLYAPILSGLEWFYPKILRGGVILVHDYFNANYKGAKQAVDEFCHKMHLAHFPIGDGFSVMIIV